jgi:hypothetical protein
LIAVTEVWRRYKRWLDGHSSLRDHA